LAEGGTESLSLRERGKLGGGGCWGGGGDSGGGGGGAGGLLRGSGEERVWGVRVELVADWGKKTESWK